MYISESQLALSLEKLAVLHPFFGLSFLALKRARMPVGSTATLVFSAVVDIHLKEFFRPNPSYDGFYNPFASSRPSDRWVKPRYGSTTLQRITKDTFAKCFMHESGSSEWGWREDYVNMLEFALGGVRIPALHLAVWLFRTRDLGFKPTFTQILVDFRDYFYISDAEWAALFDPSLSDVTEDFSLEPLETKDVLKLLRGSPSAPKVSAAVLSLLDVEGVGPGRKIRYEPARNINIVTGDNSVGKTFLLEAIWWASTGSWAGGALLPPLASPGSRASISSTTRIGKRAVGQTTSIFSWERFAWERAKGATSGGLAIYARHDGSFVVHDPAAMFGSVGESKAQQITLLPHEVRRGKVDEKLNITLCNGMYRDWVSWQTNPSRHQSRWDRFSAALAYLSPADAVLKPGQPTRVPPDDIEIPTLQFPYGSVPLSHVAAGVGRILSLAYVLVWAWSRHDESSSAKGIAPEKNVLLLVDEIEAHLHPRWQRSVVPSLINTVKALAPLAAVQTHIATHSPLVLASLETIFDQSEDALFNLRLEAGDVDIYEEDFVKQGRVDKWLVHPIFGLGMARSIAGEQAIARAREIMTGVQREKSEIEIAHKFLVEALAEDDDFWPGWIYFKEKDRNSR